jgi:vacuolar-type H+-ATPase subunit I/STV1
MLKKLKSLFVVEDPNAPSSAAKSPSKAKATTKSSSKNTSSSSPAEMSNPNAPVNKKFLDVLLKAIEANNMEGFDYLEYKQSLQSLSKMDMDELTKFQSALAMAKTMGATKTKLIKSGNHYLNVLKQEEDKFLDAHQNQMTRQVADREKKSKQLVNLISEKQAKIKKLQAEIAQHEKALEAEKSTINKSAAKVAATKDGFLAAYRQVKGQIQADIDKMKQYL